MTTVDSASNDRTANNAVRHQYRVLSDAEKAQMVAIKDKGAELIDLIRGLRSQEPEHDQLAALWNHEVNEINLNRAEERVEEAVMWAVKHITA